MQQFYQMIAVEYFSLSVTIWVTGILRYLETLCALCLGILLSVSPTCFFPKETRLETPESVNTVGKTASPCLHPW